MCRHTREPTVVSRLSCRPPHLNFDRFHQPCLLPWRVPLLPPIHGRDRWGLSVLRTTWRPLTLLGQPGSPSFATDWRFFATPTRRYHGRMLIHPSLPLRVPPQDQRCLHTRKFGTLASPPPPVVVMPWGPHPPGQPLLVL